ncbi:MAG: hypothetical protein JRE40_07655 [Deltaproteobacteria bacterium]|nr:hypothetical protein [Deltaproteobacteria bacterium]MBW2674021.1 hypothetical protein [Deltaproteobacteria bacterium]
MKIKKVYVCRFCGAEFDSLSECARHIGESSAVGMVWPDDIEVKVKKVKARRRSRKEGVGGCERNFLI